MKTDKNLCAGGAAEQQAATLEETPDAPNDLTSLETSAEETRKANQSAAARDAADGASVCDGTVQPLDGIWSSVEAISNILGIVDEIAFQTGLLVLNAYVEAERVGDFGRGFAVMASEVTALAQRSANAAHQIKGLIAPFGTEVEEGVKLIAGAGHAGHLTVDQVVAASRIVSIANHAPDRSLALTDIKATFKAIDQAAQHAETDATTGASKAVSNEAGKLTRVIESSSAAWPRLTKTRMTAGRAERKAPGRRKRLPQVRAASLAQMRNVASGQADRSGLRYER